MFIQGNIFENALWKMDSILSRLQSMDLNDALVKPPLKLGRGWILKSHTIECVWIHIGNSHVLLKKSHLEMSAIWQLFCHRLPMVFWRKLVFVRRDTAIYSTNNAIMEWWRQLLRKLKTCLTIITMKHNQFQIVRPGNTWIETCAPTYGIIVRVEVIWYWAGLSTNRVWELGTLLLFADFCIWKWRKGKEGVYYL